MPKITVYLPDDMAEWLKSTTINVSAVVQDALDHERILRAQAAEVAQNRAAGLIDEAEVDAWLGALDEKSSSTVQS